MSELAQVSNQHVVACGFFLPLFLLCIRALNTFVSHTSDFLSLVIPTFVQKETSVVEGQSQGVRVSTRTTKTDGHLKSWTKKAG